MGASESLSANMFSGKEKEKYRWVLYKLVIRTVLSYYAVNLCVSKDYFWDTSLLYKFANGAIRDNSCTRDITADERVYIITLFGYYLNHTITQKSEWRRKDFWVLCLHHIVCLILIVLCYMTGYASLLVVT